jgi:hypothetical protein
MAEQFSALLFSASSASARMHQLETIVELVELFCIVARGR